MDLYCKIFIDTEDSYADVFETIRAYVSGTQKAVSGICSAWCEMDVRNNKEFIPDADDFLYWRYYLDIEPHHTDTERYIAATAELFRFLKKHFRNAVAACNFEDALN